MAVRTVQRVFLALLLVGVVGFVGPPGSEAAFADAHTGDGRFNATNDIGGSGPTADAGGPYAVDEGNSVGLDGTGSSGNIKSYSWQITSGGGTLIDADTATPTYEAPSNVDSDTDVTVELTVTNNNGQTDTDTATVTVRDVGDPDVPSVDSLTVTKTGNKNRKFDIDADVSDPTTDSDQLDRVEISAVRTSNGNVDYQNTITVSGDSASVSDTTSQLANKKQYRIEVTVYDTNGGDSDTATETATTG